MSTKTTSLERLQTYILLNPEVKNIRHDHHHLTTSSHSSPSLSTSSSTTTSSSSFSSPFTLAANDLVEQKLLTMYKIRREYADDKDDWQNVTQRVRTLEFRLRMMIFLSLVQNARDLADSYNKNVDKNQPSHNHRPLNKNRNASQSNLAVMSSNRTSKISPLNINKKTNNKNDKVDAKNKNKNDDSHHNHHHRDDLMLQKKLLKRAWDKTYTEREEWSRIVKQKSYIDPELKQDLRLNSIIDKLLNMDDPFTHLSSLNSSNPPSSRSPPKPSSSSPDLSSLVSKATYYYIEQLCPAFSY